DSHQITPIEVLQASSAKKLYTISVGSRITPIYFIKLDLIDSTGKLLSTNFYWQNVAQDDYEQLADLPSAKLKVEATSHLSGENTVIDVTVSNLTQSIALLSHLQLHQKATG